MEKIEQALVFPNQARAISINDENSLLKANDFLLEIRELRKEVDSTFKPIIERAHQAHKEALAQKKKYDKPLEEAESITKRVIAVYLSEVERKRKEAIEKQRLESLRIQEEIEKKENDRKWRAEGAVLDGDIEKAKEILNEEIPEIAPATVIPDAPKLNGTSIKKIWKWEIADGSKIPRVYLIPNDTLITRIVKERKDETEIPGIRVFTEDSVSVRSK